jgi:hypothetical protein
MQPAKMALWQWGGHCSKVMKYSWKGMQRSHGLTRYASLQWQALCTFDPIALRSIWARHARVSTVLASQECHRLLSIEPSRVAVALSCKGD